MIDNEEKRNYRATYDLDPFIIDDDGGGTYTWAQAKLQPWCDGSGTWNDPYIIDDINVNRISGFVSCLEIRNSDVYFTVKIAFLPMLMVLLLDV